MTNKRILVVGGFGEGELTNSYAMAFERIGFDVSCFDSDRIYFSSAPFARNRYLRRLFRPLLWGKVNAAMIDAARSLKPSAIMAVKAAFLNPETVRQLQAELAIPFVNYYPDNPYCGVPLNPRKTSAQRRDLIDVLREYRHVWVWEPRLAQRLTSDGVSASYLPFAVDDRILQRGTSDGIICKECSLNHAVVFIGQHNDTRQEHIGAIRAHSVGLWGKRWTRASDEFRSRHAIHQESVSANKYPALYAAACVSLNIVDDLNMPGHNMRTFEIPGSGGVMLSRFTEEQASIFPDNEAAVYYRSPGELDQCISRLISDKALSARIRRNALAIAKSHTYVSRATAIASELELTP